VKIEYLVKMANEIGAFFASEPDADQAAGAVASHLRRFWEPRMRDQIVAHQAKGGAGLSDVARKAVAQLAAEKADEADA
jgi:formate dehydrogenase subunit delta